MLHELVVTGNDDVLGALRRLGRTEDVTFADDGGRLAVAGFGEHSVALLDLVIEDKPGSTTIAITGLTELWSPELRNPHGVAFLGEHAIVVANRGGQAPIFELPPPSAGIRRVELRSKAVAGPGSAAELQAPGSVRAIELAPDLHEVLICDNAASTVARYVVDTRDGPHVLTGELLAAHGLVIPDSVAISPDRQWLAVSNHETHSVLVWSRPTEMHPERPADGALQNVTYPHGLVFTADGAHVVVADAGAPFLHVYARGAGDWSGERQPVRTVRVMDDESFLRGRYNIQEGGPKGLDIAHASGVAVVCSEHQPLSFFDLADILGGDAAPVDDLEPARREHTRATLLRELRSTRRAVDEQRAVAIESAARVAELHAATAELQRRGNELTARTAAAERAMADLAAVGDQAHRAEVAALAREDALQEQLAAAVDGREQAARHLAHLEAVTADRDAQIAALRASTSWRLTAPLRRLTGVVRRLRR